MFSTHALSISKTISILERILYNLRLSNDEGKFEICGGNKNKKQK